MSLTHYSISDGVLIAVSCKAWAQDLVHDVMERVGTVHFELMID